jgi:ferredoxin-type protein NapH
MRLGGFFVGVLLFYFPFQLLLRALSVVAPSATVQSGAVSSAPAIVGQLSQWFVEPWQWLSWDRVTGISSAFSGSWLPVLVLPLVALVAGPVFCGWLCPAGALPEHFGRIIPDRFKIDVAEYLDILPVRFGFLAGVIVLPSVTAAVQSNFADMRFLVWGLFANPAGLAYFNEVALLSVAIWIIPLGMFTKGGRGWCMFLCPAGTVMGAVSALTARLPMTVRIRVDAAACDTCGACTGVCPTRALGVKSSTETDAAPILTVAHNLCNECLDCTVACPTRAVRYGRTRS